MKQKLTYIMGLLAIAALSQGCTKQKFSVIPEVATEKAVEGYQVPAGEEQEPSTELPPQGGGFGGPPSGPIVQAPPPPPIKNPPIKTPPPPPIKNPPISNPAPPTGGGSISCVPLRKYELQNNLARYEGWRADKIAALQSMEAGASVEVPCQGVGADTPVTAGQKCYRLNDFYIRAKTAADIAFYDWAIAEIKSGKHAFNESWAGAMISRVDFPGGYDDVGLNMDMYYTYAAATGQEALEFVLPNYNLGTYFKVLREGVKKTILAKNAQTAVASFMYLYDYANRVERSVAVNSMFNNTRSVNLENIPKAVRFTCQVPPLKIPTASEYVAMSPYVRAAYKAGLHSTGELADVINSLSGAEKSKVDSADAAAGLSNSELGL